VNSDPIGESDPIEERGLETQAVAALIRDGIPGARVEVTGDG